MSSNIAIALPDKVVSVSKRYQRLIEAEQLLLERIRISRDSTLSDAEIVHQEILLHIRELGWAKRWELL